MLNEHTGAVLLAKWFMEKVRQFPLDENGQLKASASYKVAIIEDAYNVLGVLGFFEIKEKLMSYTGDKSSAYSISKFLELKPKNRRNEDELIQLGSFYLHPKLQESPRPRRVLMDYQTMEEIREEPEPFFLEIIGSFTTEDLLNYYYQKHLLDAVPGNSHYTQVSNLANSYPLDLILYLIDASAMSKIDSDLGDYARAPAFLPNFIDEGRELLEHRANKLAEGGLTKIVPKELYFR